MVFIDKAARTLPHSSPSMERRNNHDEAVTFGTVPPANQKRSKLQTVTPQKRPHFHTSVPTTDMIWNNRPLICQFRKNNHLINAVIEVAYKKVKIW
jgi:hypothetical protein